MFKVFAFLKRNTNLLSHDEYRAGHVGYHCCNSRRLKNIRGYLVNIWSNTGLKSKIGKDYEKLAFNEPHGFLDLWDGFPQVYFDDIDDWVKAATPEPNRATEDGLSIDPDWSLADGAFLFDPVTDSPTEFKSHHVHMIEEVIKPIERPEYKITKIIQFFKRNDHLNELEFEHMVSEDYIKKLSLTEGLIGLLLNFRNKDIDRAIKGFYPDSGWHFTEHGMAERSAFCDLWDGATEMYFENVGAFHEGKIRSAIFEKLISLEKKLFSSLWYVEVDENVIIIPNRAEPPDFYFR